MTRLGTRYGLGREGAQGSEPPFQKSWKGAWRRRRRDNVDRAVEEVWGWEWVRAGGRGALEAEGSKEREGCR